MSGRGLLVGLAGLVFVGWLVSLCLFTVTESQQALIVRLGRPVRTVATPGLNLKLPLLDTVVFYEKRLLLLEPPVDQVILGDQKRIEVETFTLFRIDNPLRFYQAVGNEDRARSQLAQIVSTTVRKRLGQVELPDLLTPKRDQITVRVRQEVALQAGPLGVEVADVRIRRADLPVETSQAIYDRMTSERVREAKDLRAQGFERGQEIRAKADRDRAVLLSVAQRDSQTMRGDADAEANRIATAAYGRDPAFFDLYRTLQVYRSALAPGSPTLVLSPSSALMRYFDAGPFATPPTPQAPP